MNSGHCEGAPVTEAIPQIRVSRFPPVFFLISSHFVNQFTESAPHFLLVWNCWRACTGVRQKPLGPR